MKNHIFKTILRIFVYAVLGLFGLLLLLLVLLVLPPGEEFVRGQLQHRLEQQLHQPVRLAQFSTNLFSYVHIAGLRVFPGGEHPDAESPVLDVGSITVTYDLPQLLKNRVWINSVDIDRLEIALRRDSTHGFNLNVLNEALAGRTDTVKAPDTTKGGMSFHLGTVSLGRLDLTYDDHVIPLFARIEKLAAEVSTRGEEYVFATHTGDGILRYADMSPRRLALAGSGRLGGKTLRLDSLALYAVDLALTAAGRVPIDSTGSIDLTVALRGNPDFVMQAAKKHFHAPPLRAFGPLSLDASVLGTMARPSVTARLQLPPIDVRSTRIQSGIVAARYDGQRATLDTLELHTMSGLVQGSGSYALRGGAQGGAQFTLHQIDLASLWLTLLDTVSSVQGRLSGTISASGRGSAITTWNGDVHLHTEGLTYQEKAFSQLTVDLTARQGRMQFAVTQGDIALHAHGQADERQRIQGEFSLSIPDFAQLGKLINQPDLAAGSLNVNGTLAGTLKQPVASLQAEGKNIVYRNLPLDVLAAKASLNGKKLRIDEAHFEGALDSIDQEHPLFGMEALHGGIRYEGNVSGPLDGLNARMTLQLADPRYGSFKLDRVLANVTLDSMQAVHADVVLQRDSLGLALEGRYNIDSTHGDLAARTAVITPGIAWNPQENVQGGSTGSGFGRIRSSFALQRKNRLAASAQGEGIDLKTFASLFTDSLKAAGRLAFAVEAAGTTRDPDLRLRVLVTRPQYDSLALDSIIATARLNNHVLRLDDLTIAGMEQQLHGAATIGLRPDSTGSYTVTPRSPVTATLLVKEFNLAFAQAFLPSGMQIGGIATADLRVTGTAGSPRPGGSFALHGFHMVPNQKVGPIALELQGSVHDSLVRIDRGEGSLLNTPFKLAGYVAAPSLSRFTTDIALTTAGKGALRARGAVGREAMDLTATVDSLDLSLATPFAPDLEELSGILNCNVTARGSTDQPDIRGFLRIQGFRVRPAMLRDPISQGTVALAFDRNRIRVDTLRAIVGAGPMFVNGTVDLQGTDIQDIDMKADLDHVQIHVPDKFIVRVDSGAVRLTQQNGTYDLSGNIHFGECRFVMDAEPKMLLSSMRSTERVGSTKPGLADRTALHLQIKESDSLWVDNNLALMRLDAELGLIGTLAHPSITGRLSIPEGKIFYLDRDFDVKTGTADFVDPHKLNPIVNFDAETDVTNYTGMQSTTYTIKFTATGPMDQLETNLSSDPPLENSDIIALLTLGATRTQLTSDTSSSGGAGDILVERAKMLASEKLSGFLSKKAGKALGLDSVSVTGNLFNFSEGWGPGLVLAKQVSSRTKVIYSTNVGHMNEQSIRVDYQLTPRFSLEGETSQSGRSALSLKYGFRFR